MQRYKVPYAQVANDVLNDPKLSWKAKGIYAYLFSKPETWDFSTHRIKNDSKDGREALITGIEELEKRGYLKRERQSSGRVKYVIAHAEPQSGFPTEVGEPESGNTTVGKSHSGVSRPVSNLDSPSNKDSPSNAAKPQRAEFKWRETRKKWFEGNDEAFQLIAYFFDKKNLWTKYDTQDKVRAVAKRHLRSARRIVAAGWSQAEVEKAIGKIPEKLKDEWTLDTTEKYLTK